MYNYFHGKLGSLTTEKAVIDCGGVGYELFITQNTYKKLTDLGAFAPAGGTSDIDVTLYAYLAAREDAMELYGFFTETEKALYKLLIGISGVGPKAAIAILSALDENAFIRAVTAGDAAAISSAKGIGSKIAQKIIIELKDKLTKFTVSDDGVLPSDESADSISDDIKKQAIDALTVLGYTKGEAVKAVKNASGNTLEEVIRRALSFLAQF